jgi:hypothetical protein
MLIGDSVTYDGRIYVVVGFTPTSVRPAQVGLSDSDTSTTVWVERRLVSELDAPQRAAFQVIPGDQQTEER